MFVNGVLFIGQASSAPAPVDDGRLLTPMLVIGLVAVSAIMLGVWLVKTHQLRRSLMSGFVSLTDVAGFTILRDEGELSTTAERVGELFGEQAIYARQLRLAGVLRRAEGDGLVVDAAQVSLGMEASNANINTLAKLVLIVHRPAGGLDLPEFSLLPNHFLFATVQKDPVFHHSGAFGRRNLVLGEDKYFVAHVLSGEARNALADNRELVIESRDGLLAFYLHDERVQAKDLPRFVERCVDLSRMMVANAADYESAPIPIRAPQRHPLLQM